MEHKFKEQLRQSRGESPLLSEALDEFATSKDLTVENFKEGVLRFIHLANMLPEQRKAFYGNSYAGLYDNNHLAEMWNAQCEPKDHINPHDLDTLVPDDWEIVADDASISFKYSGDTPSDALDALLKGPTVIDCGMFCQLGLWFGIRYVLGNKKFNEEFSRDDFWVTRSNFEEKNNGSVAQGNPLFAFFSEFAENSVSIEHVFNDAAYSTKHPGGTQGGQNCLVLNNLYYTFAPLQTRNGVTRSQVVLELIDAFNAEPDSHDEAALTVLFENAAFFQARYGSVYDFIFSTLPWFKILAYNKTVLSVYAKLLDEIPVCQENMTTIFGGKEGFIASFAENPAENGENYETFFAVPAVKEAFKNLLAKQPILFNIYYQGIVREFIEVHKTYATHVLSLEAYNENQAKKILHCASFIHFDFRTFLASLRIGPGLSPIPLSSPDRTLTKVLTSCELTLFPHAQAENEGRVAVAACAPSAHPVAMTDTNTTGDDPSAVIETGSRLGLG